MNDFSAGRNGATRRKGFSLIELFAVISIIAVLSSIAVVNISARSKLAKDVSVKNNLMVLRGAVSRYYAVNSKFPESLRKLDGAELKNAYLKWDAANASGGVAYEHRKGSVYLVDDNGAAPLARDLKGLSYAEY